MLRSEYSESWSGDAGRGRGGEVRRAVRRGAGRRRDAADARSRVRRPAGHRLGRLTAAELAEQLHSSAGAISGAVRYLTQTQLVDRERVPGSRKDHYRVRDDVWHVATARRDDYLRRWSVRWREGIAAVGADTPRAPGSPRRRSSSPSCRRRCPRSSSAGRSTDHAGDEVMSYVVRFAELGRGDIAVAGGKGANLGELTRAGLPVPPGFVLTTAAYRAFVDGVGGGPRARLGVRRRGHPRAAHGQADPRRDGPGDHRGVVGARGGAGRRAVLGHRGGPGRRELRRAAGHLPQRPRCRRAAGRRARVLGVAVDRARHGLPRPAGDRPGRGRAGRRRAADGRGRRGRGDVHREPDQRAPRRGGAVRRVGARRVGRGRLGHPRRPRRREGGPAGGGAHHGGQGRHDRVRGGAHRGGPGARRSAAASRCSTTRPPPRSPSWACASSSTTARRRTSSGRGRTASSSWCRPGRSPRCPSPRRRRPPSGPCRTRRRSTSARASSSSCPTRCRRCSQAMVDGSVYAVAAAR